MEVFFRVGIADTHVSLDASAALMSSGAFKISKRMARNIHLLIFVRLDIGKCIYARISKLYKCMSSHFHADPTYMILRHLSYLVHRRLLFRHSGIHPEL